MKPQRDMRNTRLYRELQAKSKFPVECNPHFMGMLEVLRRKRKRLAKMLSKKDIGT
jgi:hypothetical protein